MRTYHPAGKAQRVLQRLTAGLAGGRELRRVADPQGYGPRAIHLWRLIRALIEDGYIGRERGVGFFITQAGRDALVCLESGHPITIAEPTGPADLLEAA